MDEYSFLLVWGKPYCHACETTELLSLSYFYMANKLYYMAIRN